MAYSFPLERIYLSTEFERDGRMSKRVVGTLLTGALGAPAQDAGLDRLCHMLEHPPTVH